MRLKKVRTPNPLKKHNLWLSLPKDIVNTMAYTQITEMICGKFLKLHSNRHLRAKNACLAGKFKQTCHQMARNLGNVG